ncbi:type II toxin-antitoxin system VapC family toxin [Cellulomonas soli]
MAVVYLDTSALLKLCVTEPGTDLSAALWDGADLVATSRLADSEVRAALASARRTGALAPDAARRALAAWERLWPGLHVVELHRDISASAAVLVGRHPLRSGDALHLASALTLRSPDLVVAVWDERLSAAARAEGLHVVP